MASRATRQFPLLPPVYPERKGKSSLHPEPSRSPPASLLSKLLWLVAAVAVGLDIPDAVKTAALAVAVAV
jgi:hypothetical protein